MGNENNPHHHHHRHHRHHHHHHHHHHSKTTFLPMLCSKPSIKDVTLPKSCLQNPSNTFSVNDPSSPRISCTGQVKCNDDYNDQAIKYFKLKRIFSGKNLHSTASTTITTTRCGGRRQLVRPKKEYCHNENSVPTVSIVDLDPPLPVIKRVRKPDGPGDQIDCQSLWNRRKSGGVALKNLQLQEIYHPRHHLQPTTV